MVVDTIVNLKEYNSGDFFELLSRVPGTYVQVGDIRGNSILSSVFVKSIDVGATLKVNYYDTTTGASDGERFDLISHDIISGVTTPTTFRILVPRIHHRVVCEVIVTGGNAEFSVYVTVVPSSTSDLDQALIRDGQTHYPLIDKAMIAGILDDTDGKLYFLRGDKGSISFSESFGTPKDFPYSDVTIIGTEQTVISQVIPSAKQWRMRRLSVHCRAYVRFDVYLNSDLIGSVFTNPIINNDKFIFDPFKVLSTGDQIDVKYNQTYGPILDVSVFLYVTEHDA